MVESSTMAGKRALVILALGGPMEELEIRLALLGDLAQGVVEIPAEKGQPSRFEVYLKGSDREAATALMDGRSARLQQDRNGITTSWRSVPAEDWNINWRDYFSPVSVTGRITIVPDWDSTAVAPLLIRLRPGMGFGTGHHPTTRLILQALERLGCHGARVLDLGTGSGILAIAAALLGATSVEAVDCDPDCTGNFNDNLALNHLPVEPRLVLGDVLQWSDFDYDLVLANINRTIVFQMLARYARTASQARLIISGLLTGEEGQLESQCRSLGLITRELRHEEEWLCAVVGRP